MIIQVKDVVKRYGELRALDHFSLEVNKGEIFGLLGPNGSGKTTAINCMLSLIKFESGTINIFGEEMKPSALGIKRRIGVVPQNVAVFNEMNVYDNIDYFCSLYSKDRRERKELVARAIDFVGLNDYVKFKPKKLSGGLLRRLNIACGIAHRPELIFFDEPTVAVDPQSRNHILEGIARLRDEGATIVYTSHYMEEVEQLCTRIMIMDKGRSIALGTKDELKAKISAGSKVTVSLPKVSEEDIAAVKSLPGVTNAVFSGGSLTVHYSGGQLVPVLDMLSSRGLPFGQVSTEAPTLNDVFLAITGKQLRD